MLNNAKKEKIEFAITVLSISPSILIVISSFVAFFMTMTSKIELQEGIILMAKISGALAVWIMITMMVEVLKRRRLKRYEGE